MAADFIIEADFSAENLKESGRVAVNVAHEMQTAFQKALDVYEKLQSAGKSNAAVEKKNPPKQTTVPSAANDPAMQRALADIRKYQQSSIQMEKDLTRQVQKEAEAQYQARVRQYQRGLSEFQRILNQEKKLAASSSNNGGLQSVFGGTFLGSFFGASAADLVGNAISTLQSLAKGLFNAGVEAVQTGARFEQTELALSAVVGGARTASAELKRIDQVAQNTPGLRLESAEQGYQQLRNLGFAAQFAENLIKGLGQQRLLSNADEASVQRVIVNFTQLANGSARASQDIREIIHAMPSLKNAFIDAFNTLDGKKIAAAISKDPQAGLEKLVESMNKTAKVAGGAANAYEVLMDEVVLSQREFSKPILEPTTKLFEQLTKILKDNRESFAEWGKTTASVINLVADLANNRLVQLIAKASELSVLINNPGVQLLLDGANLVTRGDKFLNNLDPSDRELQKYYESLEEAENVALIKQKDIEAKKAAELERINQENRNKIESIQKVSLSRVESAYKIHAAQIKAVIADNYQAQVAQAGRAFELESKYMNDRYNLTYKLYQQRINLADDDKERFKLSAEAEKELNDLRVQRAIFQSEQERLAEEARRRETERQRSARLENQNLTIFGNQSFRDLGLSYLQEQLEKRKTTLESYQTQAVDLINRTYKAIGDASTSSLNEELAKIGLQEDEKANIRRKYAQAEVIRNEQKRKDLQSVDDKAYAESLARLNDRLVKEAEITEKSFQQFQTRFQIIGVSINNFALDSAKSIKTLNDEIDNLYNNGVSPANFSIQGLLKIKDVLSTSQGKPFEKVELDILDAQSAMQLEMFAQKKKGIEEGLKSVRKGSQEEIDLQHQLTIVTTDEAQARLTNLLNWNEKYAQTLDGLKEKLSAIRSGNKQAQIELANEAQKTITKEISSNYQDIAVLKERIANIDTVSPLEIEKANLQDILDLRNRETDAIIATNRAQLELSQAMTVSNNQIRAGVYEHLASQKTLNQSIADGINQTYDAVVSKVNSSLDKLNEKTKGFLSFIIEPLKAIQSNAISSVFSSIVDKIFPPEISGLLNKTGNPLLDENKQQTKYLKNISDALTGRISLGNASLPTTGGAQPAGGFNLGSIIQSIFGGGSSPSGGGNLGNRIGINSPYVLNAGGAVVNQLFSPSGSPIHELAQTIGSQFARDRLQSPDPVYSNKAGGPGDAGRGLVSSAAGSILKGGNFSLAGIGKSLGAMAPLLGLSLGSSLGGQSILGNILGSAGGLLGGLVAASVTGAIGGSLGGLFALSGALGPAAIVAAPLLLIGAYLLGRNKQRRADETTRNQLSLDSFAQIEELIKQVNQDKLDGQSALAQAASVRQNYLTTANSLKDTKTRNIAIKDVSRVDDRIRQLQTAVTQQETRLDTSKKLTAEFATGVYMDSAFAAQYGDFKRRNGMLPGQFTGRDTLPSMLAMGEMVLNPKQINRVINVAGFDPFKYAEIPNYQPKQGMQGFAAGVNFAPPASFTPVQPAGSSNYDREPDEISIAIEIDGFEKVVDARIRSKKNRDYIFTAVVSKAKGD